MRQFVESLGRLYAEGKIGFTLIRKMLSDSKITDDEYKYIISAKQ